MATDGEGRPSAMSGRAGPSRGLAAGTSSFSLIVSSIWSAADGLSAAM